MNLQAVIEVLRGDQQAERAIPKRGFTAQLTTLTAAALAFLAVFVLAASLSASRMAEAWASDLSGLITVRIPEDVPDQAAVTEAALTFLSHAPGVAEARIISAEEEQALLAPWLGPNIPTDLLPLPKLIEVTPAEEGVDFVLLGTQLSAAVPGALLDDHSSWHRPLVAAAQRARLLAWGSVGLLIAVLVGLVTLAAQVSLISNRQTIGVLRLVGATDDYIAQAFVRRFTMRGLFGAAAGTLCGVLAIRLVVTPSVSAGLGLPMPFPGWHATWLVFIPILSGATALIATRLFAHRALKEIP